MSSTFILNTCRLSFHGEAPADVHISDTLIFMVTGVTSVSCGCELSEHVVKCFNETRLSRAQEAQTAAQPALKAAACARVL